MLDGTRRPGAASQNAMWVGYARAVEAMATLGGAEELCALPDADTSGTSPT